MSVFQTLVTKANLQYYHGKLMRLINDIGMVKKLSSSGVLSSTSSTDENLEAIMQDAVDRVSVISSNVDNSTTVSIENVDLAGSVEIKNYLNDDLVNFTMYLSSGGVNRKSNDIYKKAAVDSMFATLNGMTFQVVDTSIHSTLTAFTDKDRYMDTGGQDPQLEPWFWMNKIALYPYDGEYLEYVWIWDREPTIDEWQNPLTWQSLCRIEFIGSTKQDLTGYLQDNQIEPVDNDYIDYLLEYSSWGEGAYTVAGVKSNRVMTDSSLSAEPVFVVNNINNQVITEFNDAIDFSNTEKIIVLEGDYQIAGSGGGLDGTGFSGLNKIEKMVFKGTFNFTGVCFNNTGDLNTIYVPEGTTLTPENLGNCTAKIIYC